MKRFLLVAISLLFLAALSGCKGSKSCPPADQAPGAESSSSGEENSGDMITSDMLSQSIYAVLQADWDAWDAKNDMEKAISSRMPGHIYKGFHTWAECEEFLGFELINPLENSEFEKGSYVGMPEGFNDASRFYVSFSGTKEGTIQWIFVDSGYRDGDVRITVNAHIYPDKPSEAIGEQMITEDSGERYVATSKTVVLGPVIYNIRVIGDAGEWDAVRTTIKKVLPYFEDTNLTAE